MNTERAYRRAEIADEASKWTVGLGIIVMAIFPLAIPILVLTAVAVLPLLLPLLAIGLIALPVLLVRRVARAVSRRKKRRAPKSPPLASELNLERAG